MREKMDAIRNFVWRTFESMLVLGLIQMLMLMVEMKYMKHGYLSEDETLIYTLFFLWICIYFFLEWRAAAGKKLRTIIFCVVIGCSNYGWTFLHDAAGTGYIYWLLSQNLTLSISLWIVAEMLVWIFWRAIRYRDRRAAERGKPSVKAMLMNNVKFMGSFHFMWGLFESFIFLGLIQMLIYIEMAKYPYYGSMREVLSCVLVLVAVIVYFIQERRTAKGKLLPTVVFAVVMYCASVGWGMFAMLIKLTLASLIVAVLPFNVIGWLTVEILNRICGKIKKWYLSHRQLSKAHGDGRKQITEKLSCRSQSRDTQW